MISMTPRIENYDGFVHFEPLTVIVSMTSLSYHTHTAGGGHAV